jgi:predicted RNase H-like HicB family nuclease
MRYTYIVEKAGDGSFSAYIPDLPGCTTCGDSIDEVKLNMKEAIALYIDSLREHGESVPPPSITADVVEAA